uniref:HABP4_PAI-RBP1 domain-containing protein n=1 Tax=Syphacia muris TaxID=451379 RepID=A0A0N5ASC4_9BILA
IVGGENTSSVDKEKNEVKSVENEKPVETQKVEENNNPVVDTEKAVEDAEKSAGEGERSEEVKSSSSGGRGRGRGRGRGGRNSSRSSGVKPQPEVSTEGIANTRPRRSTRSTVDYANPDVATVVAEQEDLENEACFFTRGRGRGRGRGGHRGGKRGADDDDDGEDSGSEYGSTSARGRGRGRGRGGRSRSGTLKHL